MPFPMYKQISVGPSIGFDNFNLNEHGQSNFKEPQSAIPDVHRMNVTYADSYASLPLTTYQYSAASLVKKEESEEDEAVLDYWN